MVKLVTPSVVVKRRKNTPIWFNDHTFWEPVNLCPLYANRSNAGVDVCATCPFNFFDESVKEGNGRWMERPMGEIVIKSIGMVDSFEF